MTLATASKLETHPSLARDAAGNLLPVPDRTCAWRICRETSGRPREIRGPDKNPVRFPLHTSSDDLVELCGPGIYRVYALDQLGELLGDDHIVKWDLLAPAREHRNASIDPMLALRADRVGTATTTAPTTDLRFALETMAQMMRTNSDALRLVAESQVDLAKTIATVKGLPRNAAMYLPPAPPAANDAGDEDDEDDGDERGEESQPPAPTNYFDLLMPFSEAIAGKVADMVPGLFVGMPAKQARATDAPASTATPASQDHDLASRPFEARELFDIGYAHRKAEAKRAATERPASAVPLQARVMKDPQLVRQIMAIKNALASDEIEMLLSAAAKWSDADQTQFLDAIKPLPVANAVLFCREVIATIRAHQAGFEGEEGDVPVSNATDGATA